LRHQRLLQLNLKPVAIATPTQTVTMVIKIPTMSTHSLQGMTTLIPDANRLRLTRVTALTMLTAMLEVMHPAVMLTATLHLVATIIPTRTTVAKNLMPIQIAIAQTRQVTRVMTQTKVTTPTPIAAAAMTISPNARSLFASQFARSLLLRSVAHPLL
jgi:hypothetical protein